MGTIAKGLELLSVFSRTRPLIGLSELARQTGVNKATCFRLMRDLQQRGFVEQVGAAREYRLGPAVLGLAALREAHVPTREAALPVIDRLAQATGETAHLSHRVGDGLQTLAFAYGARQGTKVMMEDADWLPWTATASGLAVLAFLAPDEQAAILAGGLPRKTDRTETDPAAIRRLVAAVRVSGMAEAVGTFEADVHSFAFPLFSATGQVQGAVAVAAPAARMTAGMRLGIGDLGRAAAREVTALWGGRMPDELDRQWAGQA
jgi:IclR family transcriptional regulator, acetate operon repressor